MKKVQSRGTIRVHATDDTINDALRSDGSGGVAYTRHFNQSEEFFLKLSEPFDVPSFRIHHDIRKDTPSGEYAKNLRALLKTVVSLVPGVFRDLTYAFDPADVLRPTFYRVFRFEERLYLYHVRMDLVYKPQRHEVVQRGTNDVTPVYRTDKLVLDANIVPLAGVRKEGAKPLFFEVDQLISDTWIGETGRGYFVQGIWIDSDLTKFFSKLVLPAGKRVYPYYPFNSKFRTICLMPYDLEADTRSRLIPALHETREFLAPHLESIQEVLRKEEFTENMPLFKEIKETVPAELERFWHALSMNVYLDDDDMKEFQVIVNESS